MGLLAGDVMDTNFYTLRPQIPIAEAVKIFKKASQEKGQIVFGMMVTDQQGKLIGMLSMYDIFLLIRPKHIHIWGEMADIDVAGIIDQACQRAQSLLVGDIMTSEVITITPDTHLLAVLDIMIKKHIRRLPVLEGEKIVGMVYMSGVFDHLLERLAG
ncbi:MAG: CBS domain-containing protein [Desulfobacteraceae bacterium]